MNKGVCIWGIEKPKSCIECFYSNECKSGQRIWFPGIEKEDIIYYFGKIPDDCPLEEIEKE